MSKVRAPVDRKGEGEGVHSVTLSACHLGTAHHRPMQKTFNGSSRWLWTGPACFKFDISMRLDLNYRNR